jgi:hypothetical protein
MKRVPVHISQPKTNLSTLVNRPGGRARNEAIAEAKRRVEEQRPPAMDAVDAMIGILVERVASLRDISMDNLKEIRRATDQIMSLAMIFELDTLSHAARNLSDLCQIFSTRGRTDVEAIIVHIRAIQLLAPKNGMRSARTATTVLRELDGCLEHFACVPD